MLTYLQYEINSKDAVLINLKIYLWVESFIKKNRDMVVLTFKSVYASIIKQQCTPKHY